MKIETNIKRNNDGVEQSIFIECYLARYPYERIVKKVLAEPTKKGKQTLEYRKIKGELGDDWYSDLTDSWFEVDVLPLNDQETINNMMKDLQ
jgi:hypothetical protein